MKESDLVHENGDFWVCKTQKNWFGSPEKTYSIYRNQLTHSVPVASFEQNEDGLSLAIAYCDYRAKRDS